MWGTNRGGILNRYILGELVSPFAFGMMAFTVLFVAGGLPSRLTGTGKGIA